MKFNILTIAAASLLMASCSEGRYWSEPEHVSNVYAFAKPAVNLSIAATEEFPTSYEVTVSRNNSGAEVTIPVTFASNTPLITGENSLTFPAGSSETKYVFHLASGMKAGVSYKAAVTLAADSTGMLVNLPEDNLGFSFNLSKVLVLQWADRGVAKTVSQWAGNETAIDIPIQEALNYPDESVRLMRLVSPYWYLEPEYADKGYDLMFFLDKEGNAKSMYQNWTYIGEEEQGEYIFFGCPASVGGYFINEKDYFYMNGFMASGSSPSTPEKIGWYETIMFQWTGYGK